MSNTEGLKPPFDVEFPDSERNLPESIERAIELGVITPRMIGYRSSDPGAPDKINVPQSAKEANELQQEAEALARKYGGHRDDYDWRCQ